MPGFSYVPQSDVGHDSDRQDAIVGAQCQACDLTLILINALRQQVRLRHGVSGEATERSPKERYEIASFHLRNTEIAMYALTP